MTQLIVTDLDRTLLRSDKSISPFTAQVLSRCRAAGIKLVFATARAKRTALHFAQNIAVDARILHNGAVVYIDKTLVLHHGIASHDTNEILRAISRDYPQATLAVEIDDTLYANFDISAVWSYTPVVWRDFTDLPDKPADKILVGISATEDIACYEKYLPENIYIQASEETVGMIMNRAATKWNAIRHLAKHWGIPTANIVAFGDDWNDIDMLRHCGMGVAVANALPQVKAAANAICASNDEDGVAQWLQQHVLQEDTA
ncbi:MAG: HAD family hydrolase [Oscillospiraceae bacterium]|nr:HAD family hydrolase [Oscillospiraceae bacterium]